MGAHVCEMTHLSNLTFVAPEKYTLAMKPSILMSLQKVILRVSTEGCVCVEGYLVYIARSKSLIPFAGGIRIDK